MKIEHQSFKQVSQVHNEYYTLLGMHDFLDDSGYPRLDNDANNSYAKLVNNKPSKLSTDKKLYNRYYIKVNPNNQITNPIEIYSEKNNDLSARPFINKICKKESSYKEVTQSIFNKYIEFLKTKKLQWLKDAQRDLL